MAAVNPRRRTTRANPVSDENAVPTQAGPRTTRTANGKDNALGLRARATSASSQGTKSTFGAPLGDITKGNPVAGGRKRVALGSVTNNDKNMIGGGKEKEDWAKEFDKEKTVRPLRTSGLARPRAQSATAPFGAAAHSESQAGQPSVRPPNRRTRSSTVAAEKPPAEHPVETILEAAEEKDDDAMEVDPPEPEPAPIISRPQATRRTSARLSAATTTTATTITAPKRGIPVARQPLRAKATTTATTAAAARPIAGNAAVRRSKVVVPPQPIVPPPVDDDEQDEGAPVKKRRTSSMDADEADTHPHMGKVIQTVVARQDLKRKIVKGQEHGVKEEVVEEKQMMAMRKLTLDLDMKTEEAVETKPKDFGWENLDEGDELDPMMVSEYAEEIFEYMSEMETKTMPNPNYMDTQKELSWQMRGVLVDWLVQIHGTFRLIPETLFLCINIVDRFLSVRVVSLVRFQLVGVAALFIAAKYEETMTPSVQQYVACCDAGYDEQQVLQAEAYILRSIGFDLSYPGPMSFLRRASKAEDYDIQTRTLAKYLVEIAIVDWRLIDVKPSLASAAAIWVGRLVLEKGAWNPNLVHYSTYAEEEVLPVAHKMVAYVLREPEHENFHKKYARKLYCKASLFLRDWARGKWPGRKAVSLEEVLAVQRRIERDRKKRGEA